MKKTFQFNPSAGWGGRIPTVEEMWRKYATEAQVPPNSKFERLMKQAFFTGIYSGLSVSHDLVADLSEEAGVQVFQSWKDECEMVNRGELAAHGVIPRN